MWWRRRVCGGRALGLGRRRRLALLGFRRLGGPFFRAALLNLWL
jgi:hypothetical protein